MKFFKVLIAIFCVILLSGCSSITIEINDFEKKMDADFKNMIKISDNELKDVYDINTEEFAEYTFKISYTDPKNIYILVLPKKSKKKAKKEVKKFFEYEVKTASEENKKRIKNYSLDNIDDYLIYIVSDNNKEIFNKIDKTLREDPNI